MFAKFTGQAAPDRAALPTMYDLPSEDPEEPGVPDQFHTCQANLLTETFRPPGHARERFLTAADLNLYYDVHHTGNYKCPDWFAAMDVPHLYGKDDDLRLSYVVWQEGAVPLIVVELLSPGTEKEDLGMTVRKPGAPPTKWEVYEQILGIPYYILFSRHTDQLRAFVMTRQHRYREVHLPEKRLWLPGTGLGLGLWDGTYQDSGKRLWLRCYDSDGNWIPTADERRKTAEQRAEQERQQAEQERQRAEQEKKKKKIVEQQLRDERELTRQLLARLAAAGVRY